MEGLPSRMGYDRAITVFSPDGRILQVEYARKTVNQGTPAVGITYKNGVILIAVKKVLDKLTVIDSIEKVSMVDDHIGATMAGLIGDGRVLIERARQLAQRNRITYDEPIEVVNLVKEICNFKQQYTQYGGIRPFGISLLIAGIDESPKLFVTEPSGIYFEYLATAIGERSSDVMKYLEKHYKPNMSFADALKLGVNALKQALKSSFEEDKLDVGIIDRSMGGFKTLTVQEAKKIK
jgi:proteasome alpha subunit